MNKWKLLAITFMILFILETTLFIWAYKLGSEEIENEEICSYNICEDYEAYLVEDNICYCYYDNEIKHQEYIR